MHSAEELRPNLLHLTRRQVRRELTYGWMVVRGALARRIRLVVALGAGVLLVVAMALGAALMASLSGVAGPTPTAPTGSVEHAVDAPAVAPVPAPLAHRVGRGETLGSIGQRYQVSYQAIAEVNRLANPHRIAPGQQLLIPSAVAASAAPPATATATAVTVAPNDTLYGIARAHGQTVAQLLALNPQLSDPNKIAVGASLRVA